MTLRTIATGLLCLAASLGAALSARADIIVTPTFSSSNQTAPPDTTDYEGIFYDESSSFPPSSILIGTFQFKIPAGAQVLGATLFGTFGDVNLPTTALSDLYVLNGTIVTGRCDLNMDGTYPPCAAGTVDGSLVPWSHTFSSSELTRLAAGFAAGVVDFTAVQNSPGAVVVGAPTLDIRVTPEPASILTLAGGLAALAAFRRRKLALVVALAMSAAPAFVKAQIVTWSATSAPVQSTLAGGPWTLSQGVPQTTYCSAGSPIVNPLTTVNTMNPFYFPFVTGIGNNLQGYFDYRPDAINEALIAAKSTDGGLTWQFQQQVASLSSQCPTANPAAGNDVGEGHPHLASFLGATWLYALDRRNGYVDNAGMIVQRLTPNIPGGQPLKPVSPGTTFTPPASLPAGVSLFAGWDFNSAVNSTVTYNGNSYNVNNSPAPSIGLGTAIVLGMTNNYSFPVGGSTGTLTGSVANADITSTEGSTDPQAAFNSNSWRVRGPACTKSNASCGTGVGNGWNTAAPQYTQGVEFDVPTTGQYHVVFQYDWYVTAQGIRTLQAQYNTNVTSANGWTNVGPIQVTPDGGGFVNQITVDFTALGISGADNNPNFGVRLVSVYDPSYTGPGAPTYTGATLNNGQPAVYNNNSGNWRFDEVNFFGNNSPATSSSPISTVTPTRTTGLLNPDGILAVVPGTYPVKVLYVQKQLEGDYSFPASQQCTAPPVVTPYYPYTLAANHDISTVRLATTTNGINFTDLGPVTGLNDSTTVSYAGIRYVSPNGGLISLPGGNWGLFFGAGNCIDADSDSFHAIAYAESSNLTSWTVYNGINNPIVSRPTAAFMDQATGNSLTIPAVAPVVGVTQPWFAGRVYAPNAIVNSQANGVSLIFDGYNQSYAAKGSAKDLSSYRNIGQVFLSSGGVTIH